MIKFYVTRTRYHRVGHIFITFIYGLSAIRDFLLKYLTTYLIAFTFSGLSENASHIAEIRHLLVIHLWSVPLGSKPEMFNNVLSK